MDPLAGSVVDFLGALLSLISAYFYIKEKPVAWLISLAAIPFDVAMDISIGVYGDLFLQLVYFVLLIYGWLAWRSGGKADDGLAIVRITFRQMAFWCSLALLVVYAIQYGLKHYTNSEVALMDATVTCLSLVASWLLCRKVLESWLLWVMVDVLYGFLFIYKQMPFHGAMAFFDAGVCVTGYLYWLKAYRAARVPAEEPLPDLDDLATERA